MRIPLCDTDKYIRFLSFMSDLRPVQGQLDWPAHAPALFAGSI